VRCLSYLPMIGGSRSLRDPETPRRVRDHDKRLVHWLGCFCLHDPMDNASAVAERGDWVAAYHPIESVPILLLVLIWCLGVVWPVSRWLVSRNLTSLKVVLPVGLVAGWLASAGYVLVRYLAAWLGVRPILMHEVLPDRYDILEWIALSLILVAMTVAFWALTFRRLRN
jgi:hypothetical protein